jgi:hypothetical protein
VRGANRRIGQFSKISSSFKVRRPINFLRLAKERVTAHSVFRAMTGGVAIVASLGIHNVAAQSHQLPVFLSKVMDRCNVKPLLDPRTISVVIITFAMRSDMPRPINRSCDKHRNKCSNDTGSPKKAYCVSW